MSSVPEPAVLASAANWSDKLRLYVDITRPRVMALVVFTGLPALLLGQDVWPAPLEAAWILFGTACAGGASSAFNAWWERETDAAMARTRRRPLPAAVVVPNAVLAYGALLTLVSTAVLYLVGGLGAALISLATITFYVLVYTIWLKPITPQNIVIGGAAGGTAPLIASAALDGVPSLGAWLLFLIIFLWTPPHFWGIAIFRKADYAAAHFPMMPNVVGDQATRWRSLGYTLALLPVTVAPWWMGYLGALYLVAALGLGGWFLAEVAFSLVVERPSFDYRVFKVSVAYLSFLFFAMFADLALSGIVL